MNAAVMREVLRADLKLAMRERRRDDTNFIRALIAAIDNAEAVALPEGSRPSDKPAFADGSAEVARRALAPDEIAAIFDREIASRREAAAQIAAGGEAGQAARLNEEADQVAVYRSELLS